MLGTLTDEQIDHVLQSQIIGRIGSYDGKRVYIVPVAYVYHNGSIYVHSKEGMKVEMMRKNSNVCFQVDEIDNLTNWRSVILWGKYEELDREEAQGMNILANRFTPLTISETVAPAMDKSRAPFVVEKAVKPVVYRIKVTKKTGRYEKTGYTV